MLSRRGLGGSQPDEVTRMLSEGQTRLAADSEQVRGHRRRLQTAQERLDRAFDALVSQG